MRCAGFDRVDVHSCQRLGIKVARVPTYSPASVAEHAVAMLLCLNRSVPLSVNTQSHLRTHFALVLLAPAIWSCRR